MTVLHSISNLEDTSSKNLQDTQLPVILFLVVLYQLLHQEISFL